MVFDEQVLKYRSLENWFATPQGLRVASAFSEELTPLHDEIYGTSLLQLGSCGDNIWLDSFRYKNKWIITPFFEKNQPLVNASLTAIPLTRESIDCVVAPLTMEAFSKERNPLDEIDRILKSMGYVIFLGIHPWSFWGFSLKWGKLSCFANARVSLTSSFCLKHAMLERGYRQCFYSSFHYLPPVTQKTLIEKLSFINQMGKMIWPFPAGFYCLIVQKYQFHEPDLSLEAVKNELVFDSMTS